MGVISLRQFLTEICPVLDILRGEHHIFHRNRLRQPKIGISHAYYLEPTVMS